MWVTKLLISPVKKRIFCPKTTKLGPKLAFLVDLGQAMQAYSMPCCGSVGGCGARAVSRKTPIYFIQLYTITFTIADLNSKEFVIIFCQILAAPPVRVCRRLTILSARDPKFDERLRDLLPRPAYFQVARSCIFSPLLDSLS